MADGCRIEFQNSLGETITDAEWQTVQEQYAALSDTIRKAGFEPRQILDELARGKVSDVSRALDEVLDQIILNERKEFARQRINRIHREAKIIQIWEQLKATANQSKSKKSMEQRLMDALLRLMYTPGEGRLGLESTIKSVKAKWVTQRLIKELEELTGQRWHKPLKDPKFRAEVIDGYHDLMHGRSKSVRDEAHAYAKHLYDVRNEQRTTLNMLGGKLSHPSNGLPIHFNWGRAKANRDGFIDALAKALNEKSHGDEATRRMLAGRVFDQLERTNGILDWDQLGDVVVDGSEPVLHYQDGASWRNLNDQFGQGDFLQTISAEMEHLATREAEIRLFGPNPRSALATLIEKAAGTDRHAKAKSRKIEARYERLTRTFIPDHVRLSRWLGAARNIEVASKLGSAVISAITDVPMLYYAMRRFYNAGMFDAINGMLSGDKQRARYLGTWAEGALGYTHQRFGVGAELTDSVSRGSSAMADFIMRVSGLNLWTGQMKAGATRILDRTLGDIIRSGATWADVAAKAPQLHSVMIRYGIQEPEWNRLAKKSHLDDGEFDLFLIPDEATSGISLKEKLTAFYIDAVESGIITPGAMDKEITDIGALPGSGYAEFNRILTQFMTFGVTAHRKITNRTLTDQTLSPHRKMIGLAQLMITSMIFAGIATQAREVLKGNKPYAWDEPELWTRSLGYMPFGVAYDQFWEFAGEKLFNQLTDREQQNFSDQTKFLPPLLADISKLFTHGAMALGGALYDEKLARKGVSALSRDLLGLVPGQNLWWLRGAYRAAIVDHIDELLDPQGYRKRQRRILRDTKPRADSIFGGAVPRKNQGFIGKALDELR